MTFKQGDIAWVRKRIRWGPLELNGLITPKSDFATTDDFEEGFVLQNPRVTDKEVPEVFLREIADYGIVGLGFKAAGDILYGYVHMPYDLNPLHNIGFRIQWTQSAAVSTDVEWILLVGIMEVTDVFFAEDAAGHAALDTVIPVDSGAIAAWRNIWTARGIRTASTLSITRSRVEGGALIRFSLEAQALGSGIANLTFLGLEMDYVAVRTGLPVHTGSVLSSSASG